MNIEIANRLVNLRKNNNLSQEALAEKLGISRQAVSKWERAEASPDTDNLILLARLYGVSLDELLQTEEDIPVRDPAEENPESQAGQEESDREKVEIGPGGIHVRERDGSEVHIGWNGIHVDDKNKGESVQIGRGIHINGEEVLPPHHMFPHGLIIIIITIAYLLLGSLFGVWHPAWLLFLLIPVATTLYDAILRKNPLLFAYPVVVTLLFLIGGFFYNAWHPGWIWFLTIPVYYYVVNYIRQINRYQQSKSRQDAEAYAGSSGKTERDCQNEKKVD